ncbi:hypothetical protein ACNQ1T_03290 [Mycoplasma sp. 1932B]|uniref:hypothetical protein n=1 Tax=Mycoplasma sp. 1932B TaxID=3401670 RepID=UPI003AB086E2
MRKEFSLFNNDFKEVFLVKVINKNITEQGVSALNIVETIATQYKMSKNKIQLFEMSVLGASRVFNKYILRHRVLPVVEVKKYMYNAILSSLENIYGQFYE